MNAASLNHLIALLASGDGDAAADHLKRFPNADRSPAKLRAQLAERVHPEVMAMFERFAPWLVSTDDGLTARIRRVLHAAGRDGVSMRELGRKVRVAKPAEIRERVQALIDVREVHIELRRTAGTSAEVFRLFDFAAGIPSANIMNDPGSFRPLPLE